MLANLRYETKVGPSESGSNPFLTPLGEKLGRGEAVKYEEFFPNALPPQGRDLTPLCLNLMEELETELYRLQKEHGSDVKKSIRGSSARRAVWQLVTNRADYPVGEYWSISPWWQSHFSTVTSSRPHAAIEQAVQKALVNGPNDLDIRLEYPYVENRVVFAPFALDSLPKIVQKVLSKYPPLKLDYKRFIAGVNPFGTEDGFRFTTYIGNIFRIFDDNPENPLLIIDLGVTNANRNSVYAAHNYGELYLLFDEAGARLPEDDYQRRLINYAFSPDKVSWFTPMHGLKKMNILVRGSRQVYSGAFHDLGLPTFDERILEIIHKLKYIYPFTDEKRIPEIIANCIVGLMADPRYAYICLRLVDYLRQFPHLRFLADDKEKQLQMQEAIEKRMMPENFNDGVWDPFIIVDAYNEIGGNMKKMVRTFSGLIELFNPEYHHLST